jgi:hypothetical protein
MTSSTSSSEAGPLGVDSQWEKCMSDSLIGIAEAAVLVVGVLVVSYCN